MIPGAVDPKKVEQMLKQLGMEMEEIKSTQVIIKSDTGDIIIDNPHVVKTTMRGQVIYQVSGNVRQQISPEDIQLVMDQTGIRDEEKVKKAIEEARGDIVEAIMRLRA
ncbi:MAG: nascent polypeptide-associated complex protein [Candidatus Aenigmarchaeota archaeon]|nr:nascent polypeptide-associated complex protein [Candidatus Aenigmarchaeota archaeon]MCX8179200.1 nascent polypeptide-associated complex protein [Candidatus Aenigmarchaeota archaeon]